MSDIDCPSCGSSFSLVVDETLPQRSAIPQQIAKFRLIELLGSGAFGSVWKAEDVELQRIVAIKVPRRGQLTSEETEKFIREARAVAQLKHPRIVSVHEVGRQDDTVYIVSDLVEGVSLSDWLTGKRPSHREAAELCRKIADALEHAHQAGVVHRDLKPANIMLDSRFEPHIMDFGLAKRDVAEVTMTADGQVLGTPAYMSPEQARGEGHHADGRSDVYSLGVILYEMLTGERPFRGNARMLLHQVLHEEPQPPRKLDPRIARDLETICLKCLDKKPDRRYQRASDLSEDLGRWLNHEPIAARPIGPTGRMWRWAQRNPALAVMTAIAAVALIGTAAIAVAFGTYQWRTAQELADEQQETQVALQQAVEARKEVERQRNSARTQARIARENEGKAREAQGKAEAAQQLANERLATIRRYLYAADVTLAQQSLEEPGSQNVQRAHALLERHSQVSPDEPDLRGFEWWHLMLLCNGSRHQAYTTTQISQVSCSPDGQLFAVAATNLGSWDEQRAEWNPVEDEVRIIDAQTGQEVAVLPKHPGRIIDLFFAGDGQLVEVRELGRGFGLTDDEATDNDAGVKQRNGPDAATQHRNLLQPIELLSALAGDAMRGHFQIHRWTPGDWQQSASGSPITAGMLSVAPDGRQLALLRAGITQQEVHLADVSDPAQSRLIWRQDLANAAVLSSGSFIPMQLHFSRTGKQLALVGPDNSSAPTISELRGMLQGASTANKHRIHVIDVESSDTVARIHSPEAPAFVCFDHSGRYLALGQVDGAIAIWNLETEEEVRQIQAPRPTAGAFAESGRLFAVASMDGSTRIFTTTRTPQERTFRATSHSFVNDVAFAPGDELLVSGGAFGLHTWDPDVDVGITKWEVHGGHLIGVAFAPDQQSVYAIRHPGKLTGLLTLRSGTAQIDRFELASRSPDKRLYTRVDTEVHSRFTAAGEALVFQTGGQIAVVDGENGETRFQVENVTGRVAIAHDGRLLATAQNNEITIWNLEDNVAAQTLTGEEHQPVLMAFSRGGTKLASADSRGNVWLWDLQSSKGRLALSGSGRCDEIVFPDDDHMLYASDRQLFRWSIERNTVDKLNTTPVLVTGFGLSPDGRTLVMMTTDSVWLLDPNQAQARMKLQHPSLVPAGFQFSADGKTLAVGWQDTPDRFGRGEPEVWIYHSYPSKPNHNEHAHQ